MKLTIDVPDATYEAFRGYNTSEPGAAMRQALARFKDIKPSDRVLIIPSKERQELEAAFGEPLETAAQLVQLVKQRLTLSVGNVEVALTSDQLYRLGLQAQGEDVKEFCERRIKEAIENVVDGWG